MITKWPSNFGSRNSIGSLLQPLLKIKYKKENDMASKLRMHEVQRVSYLFDDDDISGKSASNMKMRMESEFNCKNVQNEREKKSNIFVKELITAVIVSKRLTM